MAQSPPPGGADRSSRCAGMINPYGTKKRLRIQDPEAIARGSTLIYHFGTDAASRGLPCARGRTSPRALPPSLPADDDGSLSQSCTGTLSVHSAYSIDVGIVSEKQFSVNPFLALGCLDCVSIFRVGVKKHLFHCPLRLHQTTFAVISPSDSRTAKLHLLQH